MDLTMKDSLDQLFRARFQGHEVPVDPGVWTAIQGQLSATATVGDGLNDLLRDRFNEHEVDVDPSVWEGISSQLGHGAAAGTTVGGAAWGWMAAAAGTVLLGVGAWLWTVQDQGPSQPTVQVAEVSAPTQGAQTAEQRAPEGDRNSQDLEVVTTDQLRAAQADQLTTAPALAPAKASEPTSTPADRTGDAQPATGDMSQPSVVSDVGAQPQVPTGTDRVEQIIEELATQARQEAAKPVTVPTPVEVVTLPVEPDVVVEQGVVVEAPKLFIPNVFTPNGDGVNDTYQVVGEGFERILVKVFAMKNNQLVFSTHTGEAWTGVNCEEGMYLVAVEALTSDGRAVTEGKVVWLKGPR
jgi:hypothetical protein